jgi:hypothetical protein
MGTNREPRQPAPAPSNHFRSSPAPCNQSSYGGIDIVASSRSSDTNDSMSKRSKAST